MSLRLKKSLIVTGFLIGLLWVVGVWLLDGLPLSRLNPASLGALWAVKTYTLANPGSAPPQLQKDQSVPILLYHGISSEPTKTQQSEGYIVSVGAFADQMIMLKKNGYHTITMQQFTDFITQHTALPNNPILITFDDGIKDSYLYSQPILKALDFHAVMFVITDASLNHAGQYYLGRNDLVKMYKSGVWDLESHAYQGHTNIAVDNAGSKGAYYSNKMWLGSQNRLETDQEYLQRIGRDLRMASDQLNDITGKRPTAIAYPYGDIGEPSKNVENARQLIYDASKQQYKLGFIQWWPSRGYSQVSPVDGTFYVKRVTITPFTTSAKLAQQLQEGAQLFLPFVDGPANQGHWVASWGMGNVTGNGVSLAAANGSTGASVFLDGTAQWRDYTVTATTQLKAGVNMRMLVRYLDNNNYISCSYDEGRVSLRALNAGVEQIIQSNEVPLSLKDKHVISVTIKSQHVSCGLDGVLVSEGDISAAHLHGGIGFSAYDPRKNIELTVSNISAK